jgi:hypothetical protein
LAKPYFKTIPEPTKTGSREFAEWLDALLNSAS